MRFAIEKFIIIKINETANPMNIYLIIFICLDLYKNTPSFNYRYKNNNPTRIFKIQLQVS